jgi:hypothetical protein
MVSVGVKSRALGALRKAVGFDKPIDVVRFLESILDEEAASVQAQVLGVGQTVESIEAAAALRFAQGALGELRGLRAALGFVTDRIIGLPLPAPPASRAPVGHGYDGE